MLHLGRTPLHSSAITRKLPLVNGLEALFTDVKNQVRDPWYIQYIYWPHTKFFLMSLLKSTGRGRTPPCRYFISPEHAEVNTYFVTLRHWASLILMYFDLERCKVAKSRRATTYDDIIVTSKWSVYLILMTYKHRRIKDAHWKVHKIIRKVFLSMLVMRSSKLVTLSYE